MITLETIQGTTIEFNNAVICDTTLSYINDQGITMTIFLHSIVELTIEGRSFKMVRRKKRIKLK